MVGIVFNAAANLDMLGWSALLTPPSMARGAHLSRHKLI
jgi:hypothetical protein